MGLAGRDAKRVAKAVLAPGVVSENVDKIFFSAILNCFKKNIILLL
jgi:hypothetical protein